MILGKKDKFKVKQLEERNDFLEREYRRLREFERWHQNIVADTDVTLMNILKVILYNSNNNELVITQKDIEEASKGDVYVTDDILRFAKRVKLVLKDNKMKER